MKVEKAKISDALEIHALVNRFAERGEMLPRALSDIYQNLRDYFVIRENGKVIACAALHINWEDMAEVRSLAVAESNRLQGLGSMLVKATIEEAKALDIPAIFCLTYKTAFFEKMGFHVVDKGELPRKVWSECFHCPKFPDCDETALIMYLKPQAKNKYGQASQTSRVLSSQQIYDGRAIRVRVDTILTPSGRKTTREIVEHDDCIVALPLDKEKNVLMVRQFREAVGKILLELPAGGIDEGEQPADAVYRELQEEIGFIPKKITELGGFYPSPGYTTEYLHLFLATELEPKKLVAEDTHEIEVIRVPLADIQTMLQKGEIVDAKSIIGLRVLLELEKQGKLTA